MKASDAKLQGFLSKKRCQPAAWFVKPMKVLREALGPVGMVKFIQQFDLGYGDYTEEKYERPDISLDEIDAILKR